MSREAVLRELETLTRRHASTTAAIGADRPPITVHSVADASDLLLDSPAMVLLVGCPPGCESHGPGCGPGDYTIAAPHLPVPPATSSSCALVGPLLYVVLSLTPDVLASLLSDSPDLRARESRAGAGAGALSTGRADVALLDAVVRLLRALQGREQARVIAPLVHRELLWRLLRGPQGPLVQQLAMAGGLLAMMGPAVSWIHENYARRFEVGDLAALMNMSVSSFHRHFRAATAMGPIQFQKQVRLRRARSLLIGSTDSVSHVAHAVGYASSSQFSRDYRRAYGTSPTADALRRVVPASPEG